jgi:hypothetical protein
LESGVFGDLVTTDPLAGFLKPTLPLTDNFRVFFSSVAVIFFYNPKFRPHKQFLLDFFSTSHQRPYSPHQPPATRYLFAATPLSNSLTCQELIPDPSENAAKFTQLEGFSGFSWQEVL